MKHLRYARYIARHKWFVLLAGPSDPRLVEASPGQMASVCGTVLRANSSWKPRPIKRNTNGGETALEMPERFIREMVADWMGAGRVITGRWDISSWYERNRGIIVLHPVTRRQVEELLATV